MITWSIDTSRARAALGSLHDAMIGKGQDVSNLVAQRTRLLARTIMNFTPPTLPSGGGKSSVGTKKVGESAITRQLENLISEADAGTIAAVSRKWGLNDIHGYLAHADGSKLPLSWANLDPSGDNLHALHKRYRTPAGRVPMKRAQSGVWDSRVVVGRGVREPYIEKVRARVGRQKATWAKVALKLGETKIPAWVAAHVPSITSESVANIDGLKNAEHPSVTFGSSAPGTYRLRQRVSSAVRFEAAKMIRLAKLIISDYRKDIAKGMKCRAHGKDVGGES